MALSVGRLWLLFGRYISSGSSAELGSRGRSYTSRISSKKPSVLRNGWLKRLDRGGGGDASFRVSSYGSVVRNRPCWPDNLQSLLSQRVWSQYNLGKIASNKGSSQFREGFMIKLLDGVLGVNLALGAAVTLVFILSAIVGSDILSLSQGDADLGQGNEYD